MSYKTQDIIVVILLAVIALLLSRSNRQSIVGLLGPGKPAGTYKNEESWDIKYNDDGMPTKITIHRDATRS